MGSIAEASMSAPNGRNTRVLQCRPKTRAPDIWTCNHCEYYNPDFDKAEAHERTCSRNPANTFRIQRRKGWLSNREQRRKALSIIEGENGTPTSTTSPLNSAPPAISEATPCKRTSSSRRRETTPFELQIPARQMNLDFTSLFAVSKSPATSTDSARSSTSQKEQVPTPTKGRPRSQMILNIGTPCITAKTSTMAVGTPCITACTTLCDVPQFLRPIFMVGPLIDKRVSVRPVLSPSPRSKPLVDLFSTSCFPPIHQAAAAT